MDAQMRRSELPDSRFFELLERAQFFSAPRNLATTVFLYNLAGDDPKDQLGLRPSGTLTASRLSRLLMFVVETITSGAVQNALATCLGEIRRTIERAFDVIPQDGSGDQQPGAATESPVLANLPGRASIADLLLRDMRIRLMVSGDNPPWLGTPYSLSSELGVVRPPLRFIEQSLTRGPSDPSGAVPPGPSP